MRGSGRNEASEDSPCDSGLLLVLHEQYHLELCNAQHACGSPSATNKKDIIHNRALGFGISYLSLVSLYGISDPPHSLEPSSSHYLAQKCAEFL